VAPDLLKYPEISGVFRGPFPAHSAARFRRIPKPVFGAFRGPFPAHSAARFRRIPKPVSGVIRSRPRNIPQPVTTAAAAPDGGAGKTRPVKTVEARRPRNHAPHSGENSPKKSPFC
jgi:hypothetical protein